MKQKFKAFTKIALKYAVEGIKFISIQIALISAMFAAGIFGSAFLYRFGLSRPLEVLMDMAHKYMN